MLRIPAIFTKVSTLLWYALFVPVFFMFFVSVYQPFNMRAVLDSGEGDFFANVVLAMCIIMGVMCVLSFVFYLINRKDRFTWIGFSAWYILEMTVCTYFVALFIKLMKPELGEYFIIVAMSLQYTFLILSIPFFGVTMVTLVVDKSNVSGMPKADNNIIHFTDFKKQVKFSVAKESILYVGAEENYVRIHYYDDSMVKDYLLRTSMSSITPIANKYALFRCHRSYFINPSHIKAVRRDKPDTVTAELDVEGLTVPVSRVYYKELTQLL